MVPILLLEYCYRTCPTGSLEIPYTYLTKDNKSESYSANNLHNNITSYQTKKALFNIHMFVSGIMTCK